MERKSYNERMLFLNFDFRILTVKLPFIPCHLCVNLHFYFVYGLALHINIANTSEHPYPCSVEFLKMNLGLIDSFLP